MIKNREMSYVKSIIHYSTACILHLRHKYDHPVADRLCKGQNYIINHLIFISILYSYYSNLQDLPDGHPYQPSSRKNTKFTALRKTTLRLISNFTIKLIKIILE